MKIAIISDVHANWEALNAVVRDIESQRVEKIFFLGDAVGYGPNPNKCTKLVSELCEIKLLGNHDYVALGLESPEYFNSVARESIVWTQKRLHKTTIRRLSDFDIDATFLDYYLVHATPEKPGDWNYLLDLEDAHNNFNIFSQGFCFVGHTHIPVIFALHKSGEVTFSQAAELTPDEDCRYIINVGSVGQPRDGNRDACYVVVNTDNNHITYRRVAYDLEAAQRKMKKAQLPEFLISRLEDGK